MDKIILARESRFTGNSQGFIILEIRTSQNDSNFLVYLRVQSFVCPEFDM